MIPPTAITHMVEMVFIETSFIFFETDNIIVLDVRNEVRKF